MTTYEDKKKLAEQFPPETEVLVEIESHRDPKESPFKIVYIFYKYNYVIKNIGKS